MYNLEDNCIRTYKSLGTINLQTIYNIIDRQVYARFFVIREPMMNYIKSISKAFFETKYSYISLCGIFNNDFCKDNAYFGEKEGATLIIGPVNKNPLIDPILSDNNQIENEWSFSYYCNVFILRSYAILDISSTLLNFLLKLEKLQNREDGKVYRSPYLHESYNKILVKEEQLSNKFRNINDLKECIKLINEKFYKKETKGKQIYNTIKHNLDCFLETSFLSDNSMYIKRYNSNDMKKFIDDLYIYLINYIDTVMNFIDVNKDYFIPEVIQPNDTYNFTGYGESAKRIANVNRNVDLDMLNYIPNLSQLFQE